MSEDAPAPDPFLQLLRAILSYGALAFAAGFVFGVLRELVLIPRLGRSFGKGLEFAIMIAITFALAHTCLKRIGPATNRRLLALGGGGALVLLALEAFFTLYVVRLSLEKYLESFNVLAGELFPWGLAAMICAPICIHFLLQRARNGKS